MRKHIQKNLPTAHDYKSRTTDNGRIKPINKYFRDEKNWTIYRI
ncbi:MAG: hypothetical protein H6Q16_1909 [Bacteroidetes bacterium]|nr:hypothetical protein [Bacteroidota bacterium]